MVHWWTVCNISAKIHGGTCPMFPMVVQWTKLSHLLLDGMAMIPQMPMLAGAILLETTSTKVPTSLLVE